MSDTISTPSTLNQPVLDFKLKPSIFTYICELAETRHVEHIQTHMLKYGINSKKRMALFIACCFCMSSYYHRVVDNVTDSPRRWARANGVDDAKDVEGEAISNVIFANVNGNGDADSGDGYRYRRRTPLQFFGRKHYELINLVAGIDCVNNPELLEDDENSIIGAMVYWQSEGFNEMADALEFKSAFELVTDDNEITQARRYHTNKGLMEVSNKLSSGSICTMDFGSFIEAGMLYL